MVTTGGGPLLSKSWEPNIMHRLDSGENLDPFQMPSATFPYLDLGWGPLP